MSGEFRSQPTAPPRRKIPSSWSSLPRFPAIGDRFAHCYRIVQRIGRGGFGAVYRAEHTVSGRHVAIKILEPGLHDKPIHVERFRQEAMLASALNHPNTVRLLDYGMASSGLYYTVMEFLDGISLDRAIFRDGALRPPLAAWITAQVLLSLDEAHLLGLVHRDVKPGNIFLLRGSAELPQVKVLDFGTARVFGAPTRLTEPHEAHGTVAYMAPEQIDDAPISAATDLYALGLVLYEMLSGASPYANWPDYDVVAHKLDGKPLRQVTTLPPDVRMVFMPIIARATASDTRARFSSAFDFLKELRRNGLVEVPLPIAPTSLMPDELADKADTDIAAGHLQRAQDRLRRAGVLLQQLPQSMCADPLFTALGLRIHLTLAELAQRQGEFGAAEHALRRTLEYMPPEHPQRPAAHLQLADVALTQEQLDDAAVQYIAAIELTPHPSSIGVLGNLGLSQVAQHHGDHADALRFARVAAEGARALGDEALHHRAQLYLARINAARGDLDGGAALAEQLVGLPAPVGLGALELLLTIEGQRGHYERARALLEQLAAQAGCPPGQVIDSALALSRLASERRDQANAMDMAERADGYAVRWRLPALEARAALRLASALGMHPERIDDALRHGHRAVHILQGLNDVVGQVEALNKIAQLALRARRFSDADALLQRALQIQLDYRLWRPRPRTFILMTRLAEAEGRLNEAVDLATQGVEASAHINEPAVLTLTRLALARLLIHTNQRTLARIQLEETRTLASEHRLHLDELFATAALYALLLASGDHAHAEMAFADLQDHLRLRPALRRPLLDAYDEGTRRAGPSVPVDIREAARLVRARLDQLA